eukprot:7360307-Pyramimonas_sp.AAC.1
MEGLRVVGQERRAGLQGFSARGMCRAVDGDAWLWGDELPDYDAFSRTWSSGRRAEIRVGDVCCCPWRRG